MINRNDARNNVPANWYIEYFESAGTAFGLKVKGKLDEVQSPYQKIEIWDTESFGKLMTIDGATMVSTRDNFLYHEMMSHPALFAHADPKTVVIIGGGDCGTLREALKHPGVQKCHQIDIDEQVTRLSEKYFPELCDKNNDPRAELLFIDGVQWMKDRAEGSVDVIIVDSTDPVGFAAGLFTVDFFRDCRRVLKEGGVIVQQSESPLLHAKTIIRDLHHNMRAAGFTSTQTLPFPQVVYPSGWWSCTLAGKGANVNTFREADARGKSFDTLYYSADIHRGALILPPFMQQAIR